MSDSKIETTPQNQKLAINFVKSNWFRVVHASGAWYGGDAQGNLHLTFFNERSAIPKRLVLDIAQNGTIAGEDLSKRESKDGVVREMEVDVIFSLEGAIEFHRTLGDNIKALQGAKEASKGH